MKLPNAEKAQIDPTKLRDYILSQAHPIGRFKARFFRRLGFNPEFWEEFRDALHRQAQQVDAEVEESTEFGRKYVLRGILTGPAGKSAEVVTVWIIRSDENFPRFVTAFPGRIIMTYKVLDTVVLTRDLPAHSLCAGDLGVVVELYQPDSLEVEFVTASGKTEALITLKASDLRAVDDADLVSVRRFRRTA